VWRSSHRKTGSQFEQGEIGPDLFRAACNFGLEGLVSKRRDRPYRPGRSPDWIKSRTEVIPRWKGSRSRLHDGHRRLRSVVGMGSQARR
jgi:ATP-dependent DNA ligase